MKVADVGEQYRTHTSTALSEAFSLLASASNGVSSLRELILSLAVQGKLAPQSLSTEPASALLARIESERKRLGVVSSGKVERAEGLEQLGMYPFQIPATWRWVRMADICAYIQRGKGPEYAERSKCAVISQKCVRWYGLDFAQAKFISESSIGRYEEVRFLRPGDILWNSTGTGTIGRAVVVPTESPYTQQVADSHVTVLRPLLVDPQFLWRWIQSPVVQSAIEGSASGSTNQIELATSTVRKHLVPLPPLEEQSRIVARVEELMKLCDALEENGRLEAEQHARLVSTLFGTLAVSESPQALTENWQRIARHFDLLLDRPEAVDALEQTILQLAVRGILVRRNAGDEHAKSLVDMIRVEKERLIREGMLKREKIQPTFADAKASFELPKGWVWIRLCDVANTITDGEHFRPQTESSGVFFLSAKDIRDNGVSFDDPLYISKETAKKALDRCNPERGDLLIVSRGATVGRMCIVETDETFCLLGSVILIKISRQVSSEYLNFVLKSPSFYTKLLSASGSTAQQAIYLRDIRDIDIPLPPLAEQNRIVARVRELRDLCAQLRERLTSKSNTQARLAEAIVSTATA